MRVGFEFCRDRARMVASRPDRPRGGGSAHSLHICPKGSGGRYTERIGWTARSGVLIERAHDYLHSSMSAVSEDAGNCAPSRRGDRRPPGRGRQSPRRGMTDAADRAAMLGLWADGVTC